MRIKNDQAGLTLVELLVTIVVASIVTLAACTMLLFGLRINNQSTKTSMGQNTVQVLMEALEDVAAEAKNLGIVSNPDSWMIYDTNGTESGTDDKVFFTYLSVNQTIYSGRAVEPNSNLIIGTPFLSGIYASEVAYDAAKQLLTIDVQTAQDNYSSSIYCRMGTKAVNKEDGFAELLIAYFKDEGEKPAVSVPEKNTANYLFLQTLAKQNGSRGEIIDSVDSFKYFSEWYIGGYEGHDGWNKETPWCACYVSWALWKNGKTGVGGREKWYANVDEFAKVQFLNYAALQDAGTYGDLIFFNFDTDKEADHVGVVIATEGNYIYTIEGNTAGKVAVRKYDKNDKRILGYGVLSW